MLAKLRRIAVCQLVVLISVALLGAGCGGRTAQPVACYQYGDEKKSCGYLKAEISGIEQEISSKTKQKDNTQGKNVALGVAGALLFWPALFFMDLSDADKVELEALRKRHNALVRICADKNCGFELKEIAKIETPAEKTDLEEDAQK